LDSQVAGGRLKPRRSAVASGASAPLGQPFGEDTTTI